jgi:NADH-quinone oxidoreductase subunit J
MELLLFIIIGGITIVSALCVVLQKNTLYSALFLILTFLAMAGLYLLLSAEFIAIIQVLVYAGAVMVLFLFVIMLLNLDRENQQELIRHRAQKFFGFALVGIFIPLIGLGVSTALLYSGPQLGARGNFSPQAAGQVSNTKAVASLLFTDYLLPFEITSILLLATMIGVVYLASRTKKPNNSRQGIIDSENVTCQNSEKKI